jgi:uncharacterized membrane protein
MTATQYRANPVRFPRPAQLRRAIDRVPADVWALGALTVLGAVLRFSTIASQSYWADEALTVHEIALPFGQMLSTVAHVETTPPLYFILAWAWSHVFGTGEAGLRSLSAVIGILVIPIAYTCARELVSRRAGVIAAAFAAVNPFLVWYSQEARAYMLLIALTGASLLWFVRAQRDPSRRNVAWWALLSALALATHFFAGFIVAPEALWLLWRARTRLVLLADGALAAVQLALVPLAAQDTGHGLSWIHASPLLTRISQVPTEFAVMTIYRHVSIPAGLLGGAIAIVLAALLLALAGGPVERRGAGAAATLAAVVILAPLVLGVISPADDFFLVRNLSPAWIPLCVVLAAACAAPRARELGTAVAMVVLIMFTLATIEIARNPVFQRADWRGVARALGRSTEPRVILAAGGQEAFPLKIFVHGVKWTQPPLRTPVVVDQVDVVGSIARQPLRDHQRGRAIPIKAPPDAILIGHEWVRNFDVARYELIHPWRFDTMQISARAGHFFPHRAPTQLLVLVAGGVPRQVPLLLAPKPARHLRRVRRGRHRARGDGHRRETVPSKRCSQEAKRVGRHSSDRCSHGRSSS